jgi:hypothetical protein
MPAATRATPGPQPILALTPTTNAAPLVPANTTATTTTTVPPNTTAAPLTQLIHDMDHLQLAYPRDPAESPTKDVLRYVGYAKARFTGYKPDPDADAKFATTMPWLLGGVVTDRWGLEARRILAIAGIPNSAAVGKSRTITWASAKKKLAEVTFADADGVLNWRPADDPQSTVVVPLSPTPTTGSTRPAFPSRRATRRPTNRARTGLTATRTRPTSPRPRRPASAGWERTRGGRRTRTRPPTSHTTTRGPRRRSRT